MLRVQPYGLQRDLREQCTFQMPNSGALASVMHTSPIVPRRRLWPVFVPSGLFLLLAVAWSGFWFYAASHVDEKFDEWRTREAKSGRIYECANRSVAGFPFRMEVNCENPVVTLTSQTGRPDAAHRAVEGHPGGRAGLRPDQDHRRIHRPRHRQQPGRDAVVRCRMDHRAGQRGGCADAAARLARVRRSGAGPHQRCGADAVAACEAS